MTTVLTYAVTLLILTAVLILAVGFVAGVWFRQQVLAGLRTKKAKRTVEEW